MFSVPEMLAVAVETTKSQANQAIEKSKSSITDLSSALMVKIPAIGEVFSIQKSADGQQRDVEFLKVALLFSWARLLHLK